MKTLIRYGIAGIAFVLFLHFFSCKKDSLSTYDTSVVNMKVFDDDSIALPITVTAGDNCLLSAYNTISGQMKFNLTGNDGKLIWQKQFGLNSISAILKENDGTFTILSGQRLLNISLDGTVLKDVADAFPGLWGQNVIFRALINKSNNYVITGVYGAVVPFGANRAFAAEYTHDGTQVFQKDYIDTNWLPNTVVIGNYSAITGCELMDDGGYLFFGNYYIGIFHDWTNEVRYVMIRTDHMGQIIWQKYNMLIDTVPIAEPFPAPPPFVGNPPFSTEDYGYHYLAYSHEVMRTADGNFLCFLNMPDYSGSDQRARVYKIDPNGNTLDSTFIDFAKYNRYMGALANYYNYSSHSKSYTCGNGVVKNADNTYSICMQNGFFGSKGLTNSYLDESRSFVVRIDEDMNILDTRYLQNYYTDCFTSACKSSDGHTVYFGLISSFGNSNKPALIISDDH